MVCWPNGFHGSEMDEPVVFNVIPVNDPNANKHQQYLTNVQDEKQSVEH